MAFTGNSTYTLTNYAAFAVGKAVSKAWSMIWTTAHPLLTAIADRGTSFNQGFTLSGNNKMLLPIAGDDLTTPAAGVTDANELTADTISATNGASQAAYEITHYRAHTSYRASEEFVAQGGSLGNFLEFKKTQVLESLKNRWSTDAASTTVDARDKIMGFRYALSTSNSPGGISQSTDTQWAAQVKTSAGTFALSLIDDQVDLIGNEGRGGPDLVLAGNQSGSNMYGKIRTAIGPTAERLTNVQGGSTKYGVMGPGQQMQYLGMLIVQDARPAVSGEICILSTPTWHVLMPKEPTIRQPYQKDGTDAFVQSYTLFTALGCSDCSMNARITGVT